MKPTICRMVMFRSRTGKYTVPAVITATVETLNPEGVALWERTEGQAGVPPLSSEEHVHLTVFTPGKPGMRADAEDFLVESEHGRGENVGGTYQEWDVPLDPDVEDAIADGSENPQLPGSWAWPVRS